MSFDVERKFNTHKLTSAAGFAVDDIRANTKNLANIIDKLCPESREKSLAMTKLEETLMWAVKSISVNT